MKGHQEFEQAAIISTGTRSMLAQAQQRRAHAHQEAEQAQGIRAATPRNLNGSAPAPDQRHACVIWLKKQGAGAQAQPAPQLPALPLPVA